MKSFHILLKDLEKQQKDFEKRVIRIEGCDLLNPYEEIQITTVDEYLFEYNLAILKRIENFRKEIVLISFELEILQASSSSNSFREDLKSKNPIKRQRANLSKARISELTKDIAAASDFLDGKEQEARKVVNEKKEKFEILLAKS